MLQALSTPENRTLTLIFLVICAVASASSAIVGIADNPPGIILAFGAAAAFILAFTHPWRTWRPYARLLIESAVGLVIFVILHNVFEGVSGLSGLPGFLRSATQALGVVAFLLAVLVCPPAILVSLVGTIGMALRSPRAR